MITVDGRDLLEFAKLKFDERYTPPNLLEKYQLPAQASEIQAVIRHVLDTGLFKKRFPEEENPRIADIFSTEVIVTLHGHNFMRRYFRDIPADLEPLKAEVERLIERLTSQGERSFYHQGERIAAPEP